MNALNLYKLNAAAAVAVVLSVVGCATAPEPPPVGQSTTARTCWVDCPEPLPSRCYGGYAFNSSAFESDLVALGCTGKSLYSSGGNGSGSFFTWCSALTTVDDWCPSAATYTTMDVFQLVSCYANDPVIAASIDSRDPCTGAESPDPIVLWDPTCGGTRCQAPW